MIMDPRSGSLLWSLEEQNKIMGEEEEVYVPIVERELIPVCKCLRDDESSEKVEISARKQQILSTVSRTESYLRERRIPELIRFLLTKVIAQAPEKPIAYLESLLNDCMLYRAGHGTAPVLYELKHLEAVVKSFDPGNRGWMSPGQVRRAFITLGLTPINLNDDRVPTDFVLKSLKESQETELYSLLAAGVVTEVESEDSIDTIWDKNKH